MTYKELITTRTNRKLYKQRKSCFVFTPPCSYSILNLIRYFINVINTLVIVIFHGFYHEIKEIITTFYIFVKGDLDYLPMFHILFN